MFGTTPILLLASTNVQFCDACFRPWWNKQQQIAIFFLWMYAFVFPEPNLIINNWNKNLCTFLNAYTDSRQEEKSAKISAKSCRNYRIQQLHYAGESTSKTLVQCSLHRAWGDLKDLERNLQQAFYCTRVIPKIHSAKNSSFQFILKMPASQLQQFWVIAWSCHLPCEVCDVLQQRSLFSFKSQLEKTVSIPLSLMCKEISEYSPRNKCSTYLIKYVNDIKVN